MRLLTPPGHGGVAVVVAASAADRQALLACLRTPSGSAVTTAPGQPPRRCVLSWDAVARDEGLLVDRGAAGLELHLHGSPAVLAAMAARFGPFGRDEPGPAASLLRAALSPAQLLLALEQLECDFDAFLAAAADLPAAGRARALAKARERSRVAMALAQPHRLLLIGRQNAGKSTLFNRLLFRERALTGPVPGLTRDPVAEVTCLSGYPYELIDTAGEGESGTPVDAAAVERGRALRLRSDCLLLVDGSAGPAEGEVARCTDRTLVIATKDDLPRAHWPAGVRCDLRLSCLDPGSAPAVRAAVGELLRARRGLPPAGPVGGPAALTPGAWAALVAASAGGAAGA